MAQGKYSPTVYGLEDRPWSDFRFNCYGQTPAPWPSKNPRVVYDEKTMYDNYDSEGYDSYGYSAFGADGNYVGDGRGVDRNGYTEFEYMSMTPERFDEVTG